jgi:hypothetical protein
MKRVVILCSLALILLGGAVAAFYFIGLSPVIQGDITAAFSHDVGDYVSAHDGKLPSDWAEFCDWMKSKGEPRWTEKELKKRFIIHMSNQVQGTKVPVYIEITDKKIKGMESFLNQRIHYAQKQKS